MNLGKTFSLISPFLEFFRKFLEFFKKSKEIYENLWKSLEIEAGNFDRFS